MIGDTEHKEVGTVIGGDVAAAEVELSEIVFVLDKWRDLWGEIIFHTAKSSEKRRRNSLTVRPRCYLS